MEALLALLTMLSGLLFFARSWFGFKKKKILSLLIVSGSVGTHPKMAFFIAGPAAAADLMLVLSLLNALLVLFIYDKTVALPDRIIAQVLRITAWCTAALIMLAVWKEYVGYYHAAISSVVVYAYFILLVIFAFYYYLRYRPSYHSSEILDKEE